MVDWAKYLNEEPGSGLSSRSSLYLHAEEIFNALTDSYQGTEGQLKFNLTFARQKLEQLYGAELIRQICLDDDEEMARRKVLAMTGWACKQVEHRDDQKVPAFYLECVSCFFKVHSVQLIAAHLDLIKATKSGYSFEFDPLNSHMKHCYFNHSAA